MTDRPATQARPTPLQAREALEEGHRRAQRLSREAEQAAQRKQGEHDARAAKEAEEAIVSHHDEP